MPFIIVFNITVCVLMAVVLLVLLGTAVFARDNRKKTGEKAEKMQETISSVRGISYLVFFAVLILMIIINLIF